jgi:malate dehydrogenase (oxaloacetate-decarboxylating)
MNKNWFEESLKLHKHFRGKIEIKSKVPLRSMDDLSLSYTPGVASPCLEIAKNPADAYIYTFKQNSVAVISDGSAVLGLGNIGGIAGLPVMEGKALLFKEFANVDAIPIVLSTQDPDEIIATVKAISPTFGGINLEDISAPKCVYIERRLKEELSIPVFHDDQHGTSIVVLAALYNACRLTNRDLKQLKVVISGTGAAGSNIARLLHKYGVRHIYGYNKLGIVRKTNYSSYNFVEKELLDEGILLNPKENLKTLEDLITGSDVFIGVSAPNLLQTSSIQKMNRNPFVFAMANPTPEINYEEAIAGGAKVVGTGRSDYPNQINNVLAFPGLFRGVLDARIKVITDEMKIACALAIANVIKQEELRPDYVIPSPFDKRVVEAIKKAILHLNNNKETL